MRPSRSRAAADTTKISRFTAVCSSVRAEIMCPSRSRAATITSPSRSRAAADVTEKSRCTVVCSGVHVEFMRPRPSRAAKTTSPSRIRAADEKWKHFAVLLCVAVFVLKSCARVGVERQNLRAGVGTGRLNSRARCVVGSL